MKGTRRFVIVGPGDLDFFGFFVNDDLDFGPDVHS